MRKSWGSGLPTERACMPVAYSTAATTAPVAGHGPSGIGKVASRLVHHNAAPFSAAWTAPLSSAKSRRSWPLTTTTSARSARSEPLRIRSPASLTWRWTAAEPMTKAVACPDSASTCCRAPPAVTISSRAAWKPSRQSLRTKSSSPWRASLVTKVSRRPAARSAPTASTAFGVGSSPTQTQPSRSSRNVS